MRNLKKVLALALALVMTLSLMTVANAFTDDSKITAKYDEAVEVLNGLQVFQGRTDGSFDPQGSITREEVAAIIYRIATGDVSGVQVGIYKDYNVFKDVTENMWSAGYINYCANAGYIKGRSSDTFDPYGKVTGYEALAMILRAVGYDANGEFTGASWQVKVASTSKELGITDTVNEVTLNTAVTREVVAELLFRTIVYAPIVKYTTAFGYQPVTTIATVNVIAGTTTLAVSAQTLGQKTFNLKQTARQVLDKWGRPGYTWTAYSSNTAIATIKEAPLATYTTAVVECNVASVLGYDGNKENAVTTYVNGKDNTATTYVNAVDTVTKVGAQGRLTEVYADRIVMIDTLLAQVTNVQAAKFDVAGHLITASSLTLTVYDAATATSAAQAPSTISYTITGGSANFSYAVGDMLLINAVAQSATTNKVAVNTNKYAEIVGLASSITGSQTTIWYNADQHTVNGVTYNDANTFYLDEAQTSSSQHTWYFDSYGNLIGDVLVKTAVTYGVISNIWWYNDGTNGGVGSCYATMVDMNGNSYSAQIASIDGLTTTYVGSSITSASGSTTTVNVAGTRDTTNSLIYISPYSDNNVTAGLVANDLYEISTLPSGKLALVAVDKLTNSTVSTQLSYITGTNSSSASATILTNSATQYLVYNGSTFTAVTGWNNVANYIGVPVSYVNNANGYAAYVYIVGTPASQPSGKLVYVQSAGYTNNLDGTYTILNVTVDGVAGQSILTNDIALVNLLVQATDKLFYVDFTGTLAVMNNNNGSLTTQEITSTALNLSEIDSNLNAIYLAGAYLTADGLSATNPATQPVYNVTGIVPVVGAFETDMSTRGVYVTYKTVGTLNVVTSAYVTESKYATLIVAGGTVTTLNNLADQSAITVTAVAQNNYAVGSEVSIVLTRTGASSFAANSTFAITLNNGRTVTATTSTGAQSNTLTFKYPVLASDVLSYVQTLQVESITKLS